MSTPKVEIFVPVRNGARWLNATLDSIFVQSLTPIHVILSDNGSTDATPEIAQTYPAAGPEYRRREGAVLGMFEHWNLCLREAAAEYVALFHGDDIYDPRIVERQLALLEAEPELDAVLTGGVYIDEQNREIAPILIPPGIRLPKLEAGMF